MIANQKARQITGGVAELPAMDASSHACAECYLELSKYLKIPMTMMLMWSRMKERGTNMMAKNKFRKPPSWQVFRHRTQERSLLRNASKPVSCCRQGCRRLPGREGVANCAKRA